MLTQSVDSRLWTVVNVEARLFALPVENVQTMVMLPELSVIPNMPSHLRGMINLRGSVVAVVDLRKRLGMASLAEEIDQLDAMLVKREEDHVRWVDELESSVKDQRQFTLTTDPHRCAFGKWYDSFQTENLLLSTLLKKFDEPHKRIHAIADRVLSLEKAGKPEAALHLVEETKSGDLSEMIRLFAQLRSTLKETSREIAVVLTLGERTFAVTVDSVETVGHLTMDEEDTMKNYGADLFDSELIPRVGKMDKSGRLVMVLEPERLFGADSSAT